jgi:hypothetical protein
MAMGAAHAAGVSRPLIHLTLPAVLTLLSMLGYLSMMDL